MIAISSMPVTGKEQEDEAFTEVGGQHSSVYAEYISLFFRERDHVTIKMGVATTVVG